MSIEPEAATLLGMTTATATYREAQERAAIGRAARADAPRSSHAEWEPPPGRADPIEMQERQAASRVPELVPIRYGRMLVSPFAFFRGTADIMAADLAGTPASGLHAQLCGDAHLSNFGAFGSAERDLLFDVNDFDETLPGPWEWDVKRLGASLAIAGRDRSFDARTRRKILLAALREYREAMRRFAGMGNLEVWYARVSAGEVLKLVRARMTAKQVRKAEKNVDKAHAKDSMRALTRLTEVVDGEPRIVSQPPLIVPISEMLPVGEAEEFEERMRDLLGTYGDSLPRDRRRLLDGYRFVDMARKVVGVGSVGTRAWIVLLAGRDEGDPLFLQCKEAGRSVLEDYAPASEFANHGQRVVEGQRLMQASSDILLGWVGTTGLDGVERDFYVRQLWDWKRSADIDTMPPDVMSIYGRMCAWTLARAHARTGDRIAIAAYLGKKESFDHAVADFAELYADQSERDYSLLLEAVEDGRIKAERAL